MHDPHAHLLDVLICGRSPLGQEGRSGELPTGPQTGLCHRVHGQTWQGTSGWIHGRTTAHTAQERVSGLAGDPGPWCCGVGPPPLTGGPSMPGRPVAPCSPCTPRGPGGPFGPSTPGSPRPPSGPRKPGSPGLPTYNTVAQGETRTSTSLLNIATVLIFKLGGLLRSVQSEVRIPQRRHTAPRNSPAS